MFTFSVEARAGAESGSMQLDMRCWPASEEQRQRMLAAGWELVQ